MIRLSQKNSIPKLFYFFIFLFLMLIIFPPISALSRVYDPNLNWLVLESKHFSVIFPAPTPVERPFDYQYIAVHIAEIAEETYQQITPQFGIPFQPNKKIAIILEDFSDSVYGFASAIPHRSIRINLTAPGFKIFNTKFDSWLKILLAHEYTHLAHFDMTKRVTNFLRLFLGQIIAPNALQPLWAIEGLAIYNESKWTTGGRLEDSRYEMYLCSDFQENQLKSLDQIQGSYFVSWPGGNAPYIYGQSLVHFIVQQFGEEKLIAISDEFCAFPYLGMNRALKKVIGVDQNELFEQWKKEQTTHYQKQIDQAKQFSKITESQQLTNHHYWVDNPLWLPNPDKQSATLFYRVNTPQLYPTIREYNTINKKENILIKRTSGHGTSYSLSPDQQYLIYTKLTQYEKYYSYHDLFLYHLENGKQVRISEGIRIKDPAWRPDYSQNQIAAVINQAGSNNLVLFSIEQSVVNNLHNINKVQNENKTSRQDSLSFSDLIYLTDFSDGTQISQPVWSPQGNQIAFSLWQEGYQDICLLTLDDNDQVFSIEPITMDRYTDISPSWSPDGQYLYFSSDRSSIFNLYAYNLEDKQFFRLTNVLTGAFEPAISPNGKELAFIQYHALGYELHLSKTENMLWKLIDNTGDGSLFHQTENRPLYYDETENRPLYYSPINSLLPTYWSPYLSFTSNDLYIGFSSLAQDHLKFYHIPFTLAQGMLNQSLYYNVQCTDYTHEPIFSLSLQGETDFSSQLQTAIQFSDEGYTSHQDSARYFYKYFSLGFQKEWYLLNKEQGKNSDPTKRKVNSLILRYTYDDTERYAASISPEIGQIFSLSFQHANTIIGSDITFNKILFDGRKYFPISNQNKVLALRLVAGLATEGLDEKEQFHLGGNKANSQLNSTNADTFALRGFSASSFSGNHLFLSNLEYRFPIQTVEHKIGFDWASIFLERISGTFFLDIGHAWEGPLFPPLEEINASLGAEVNFKFKMAYDNPFTLTIGAGKALTKPSPFRIYAQIGISF